MTPEGRVKEKIRRTLSYYGAYWHCPVQNGMGRPSLDFIGCHRGDFFAVEAKAPGKRPTVRQEQTITEMQEAGAQVFVISEDFSELNTWLNRR